VEIRAFRIGDEILAKRYEAVGVEYILRKVGENLADIYQRIKLHEN
jgi:hypothetical protein